VTGSLRLGGVPLPLLDRARIYACGITPYDVTHLGHAATFVWVDVLGRVLAHLGAEPTVCRNVTDVDDVLTAAAARAGAPYDAFAAVTQFRFEQDMTALQVRPPSFAPRARTHVAQVIALAAGLLEVGAAYERDGSVFFRGGSVPGDLNRETALALATEYGDRPDDPAKDDPFDVAVWRATSDDPSFESPWGRGVPGWHAECAAMSLSILGATVDVQCGGSDLAFPHHAYTAAMAEAVTGVTPYARSSFRVGTVRYDGSKMAKSTGNLVLVGDVVANHPAAALRLLLLDRPWAQAWDFEIGAVKEAETRLDALFSAAGEPGSDRAVDAALDRLRDDLDVPGALAIAGEAGGAAARLVISLLGLGE
jgi:cysteinyl-tRNA synthetase